MLTGKALMMGRSGPMTRRATLAITMALFLSPHYAQHRDGNKTAIPDAYLPPGYVSRSHRVVQVPEEPGRAGESR